MSDDPKKDAGQLPVQFLGLSGPFFEIARHLILDRQATYLVLKLVFKVTKKDPIQGIGGAFKAMSKLG